MEFLRKYTNQDHVLEMSIGVFVGEQLVVTEGPLKDYQGKVVHIDRHKRMVILKVEFFGRTSEAEGWDGSDQKGRRT